MDARQVKIKQLIFVLDNLWVKYLHRPEYWLTATIFIPLLLKRIKELESELEDK